VDRKGASIVKTRACDLRNMGRDGKEKNSGLANMGQQFARAWLSDSGKGCFLRLRKLRSTRGLTFVNTAIETSDTAKFWPSCKDLGGALVVFKNGSKQRVSLLHFPREQLG